MQEVLGAGVLLLLCIAIGYSEPTFHVGEFGAIGDGKTDDSQAFLKAWKEISAAKTFLLNPTSFQGPCNSTTPHLQVK